MPTKIWVDFHTHGKGTLRSDLIARLARADRGLIAGERGTVGPRAGRLRSARPFSLRSGPPAQPEWPGEGPGRREHPEPLANGDAWLMLKVGASDVLAWTRGQRRRRVRAAPAMGGCGRPGTLLPGRCNLVGCSPAWTMALRQVIEVAFYRRRCADHRRERDGEGTGGAVAPHARPAAQQGRSCILDCTTIVPELAGSEFFGHERGGVHQRCRRARGAFAWPTAGRSSSTRSASSL